MATQRAAVRTDAPPRIEAVIDVAGDLSGQVAVGENIVQLKNVQIQVQPGGALIAAPTGPVEVRRRPRPVQARGRRPRIFVDRSQERSRAADVVAGRQVLGFVGPPGSGKSALLRELAHDVTEGRSDQEVVLVSGAGRPADDVLNDAFQLLFETDRPYVAVGAALRAHLQDYRGVLLVDDTPPEREAVATLLDTFPESAILLGGSTLPLDVQSMTLGPLPESDRRALTGLLGAGTDRVAAADTGLPGELVLAARAAGHTLPSAATEPAPAADDERRVLSVLAAAGPTGLSRALLAAAADSPGSIDQLAARGLVEEEDDRGVPVVRTPALVAAAAADDNGVDGVRQLLRALAAQPSAISGSGRPDDVLAGARAVLEGAQHGLWDEVAAAGPVVETRLMTSGRWAQWSAVLDATLRAARERADRGLEGRALHQLGTLSFCLGDRTQARSLLEQAHEIRRSLGDTEGAETTAANLEWVTGTKLEGGGHRNNGQPPAGPGPFAGHTVLWSLLGLAVLVVLGVTAGVGMALRSGSEPSLESSTEVLDIGRAVLGTEARSSFTVTSSGDATASTVTVESRPAAFTASAPCPEMDSGSTCDITVTFRPTAAGAQSGQLTVLLDGSAAVQVEVRGFGVEPPEPAGVTVSPEAVDFGSHDVGSASEPERVEIVTEPGVRLRGPTISGARPDDFAIVRETCGSQQEAQTCAVLVVFAPGASGPSVARLSMPVAGREPVQVLLSGTGVTGRADVRLEPPALDLGTVTLGTSAEKTLTLRNVGTSSVQVTRPILGGPAAGDFRVVGCADPVPAGATCTLSVTFGPREVGQRVAVLTLDTATGDHLTATLTGEGMAAGDDVPPRVSITSLSAEAESPKGAVVTYQVSAVDDVDGTLKAECDRASGDTFPIGETTVTCSAIDAAGNVGRTSGVIRVTDTTGPALELPDDITREVKYQTDKATVEWNAVAADLVDGDVPVTCTPRSGSTFATTGPIKPAPGSTEEPHVVSCTAEDASGNLTTRTFPIHVLYESTVVD